jgi:2-polyprenyl-3-methyl-5-hydroxy-6-metoxy-1,4-benzoquinol methylase
MTDERAAILRTLLAGMPQTLAVVDRVIEVWPEHARYLIASFKPRSQNILAATEEAATAARALMAGGDAQFAADYRWTCERLREEEIYFHRNERYRLSTFAEANSEVYSNIQYMGRYVNGLLLSQLLWYNHAATLEMFLNRVLGTFSQPFDYLEVGPGHGLMVFFAARSALSRALEAWDVSAVSLRETRAALTRLAVPKPVTLSLADISSAPTSAKTFDLVVISEVLEHLEAPGEALCFLRGALSDHGRMFINVPLNSPSPDHIYLLSNPDEVISLVEGANLRVESIELFATQATEIPRAVANKVSISAGIIAVAA